MNNSAVVPFYFQSHEVRTIIVDSEPWFVAKDVCDILGLGNATKALNKVPAHHIALNSIQGKRGKYEVNTVSEPGLYRLILRSDKPQAEPFMEWVTAEVLPTIRKTGAYSLKNSKTGHATMRGHIAPGNLDIRYTMDLSKVVMRPTRTGIELLERLTGIPLTDILPPDPQTGSDLVAGFVEQCLVIVPDNGGREQLSNVYQRFLRWQPESGGKVSHTVKWLAAELRHMGLTVMKMGGLIWVFGVRLAQEVQS